MTTLRITDRGALTRALLMVPYRPDGRDWSGIDCFGLAELWFRNLHGIVISDRLDIAPGADGLERGFSLKGDDWLDVETPREDDLIFFRDVLPVTGRDGEITGRRVVEHGHCGIMTGGRLLHAHSAMAANGKPSGLVELVDYETLSRRTSGILRRTELA